MTDKMKPVAWLYEIATAIATDTEGREKYVGWEKRLVENEPCAPAVSIRNLTPLYTRPPAKAHGDLREAVARAVREARFGYEGRNPNSNPGEEDYVIADAALSVTDARLKEAVEIMVELADDLEAEVEQRWGTDKRLARQLKRDMAIVERARAFIERETDNDHVA